MSSVCVVIPCLNAAHLVGRQLAALTRQPSARELKVVLVDDGSQDHLTDVVRRYEHHLDILVVRQHRRRGTGAGRNAGARAGTSDVLLFLDADDEVADDYVEAMTKALESSAIVSAGIDYRLLNPARVIRRTPPDQLCPVLDDGFFLPFALGGLVGMTRGLFEEIGGFDESLPALADLDISWRAQLAGHSIGLADTVVSVGLHDGHRSRLRRARFQARDIVPLRAKYAPHGLPAVTWRAHASGWLRLVTGAGRATRPAGRSCLVWDLGWQTGELGSLISHRPLPRPATARPENS